MGRHRHAILLGLVLNAGGIASLAAQDLPLQTGVRVRVLTTAFRPTRFADPVVVVGDLVSITGDTLFLTPTSSGAAVVANRPLAVPVSSIRYMTERIGRRSAWRIGKQMGMIAGVIAGGVIAGNSQPPGCTWMCGMVAIPGVLLGGVGGAVIGALIAAPFKTDHWREVPIERLRLGLGGLESGAVGFSFRF